MTKCDDCINYHPEVPIECGIAEYAYLTMETPNECKQFVGRKLTDTESIGMLFDDPPDIPEGFIEHVKPKDGERK